MSRIDGQRGDTFDEKIESLRECLSQLAPLYQEPVDLHYRQCKTTEWIAEYMATSRGAIQKRLQRARLQLAECLERKGVLSSKGFES